MLEGVDALRRPTSAGGATGGPLTFTGLSWSLIPWGVNLVLILLLLPFLAYDAQRMYYATPISYNEGWNAYATSRVVHGGPLYQPLIATLPVRPVNYPPLPFLFIGALARLTGHLVLLGRCVAFASFLFVGALVFVILRRLQPNVPAAILGALLWLTLVARVTNAYVGMFDPQMIGQVCSVGALALYARWRGDIVPWRAGMLALLCCLALFVKLVFVAVPAALAVMLVLRDRRQFVVFAAAGAVIALAMLLTGRLLFGPYFLPDLLVNHDRLWDPAKLGFVAQVTVARLSLLAAFIPLFLFKVRRTWPLPFIYLATCVVTAAYFFGLDGAGESVWFDFFIAVSIGWGLFAGQVAAARPAYAPWFAGGILVVGIAAFLAAGSVHEPSARDYTALRGGERIYRDEVALLRSTPGRVLFEYPLVGFDAGKDFLFDPFWGTELILTGHLPERVLTDPIRAKNFSVIALSFDVDRALGRSGRAGILAPGPSRTRAAGWTDNALLAISENYRLVDHRFSYLYVPRR